MVQLAQVVLEVLVLEATLITVVVQAMLGSALHMAEVVVVVDIMVGQVKGEVILTEMVRTEELVVEKEVMEEFQVLL
jgi:hypothetical protein